jgi:hypothetical protein
MRRQRIAIFLTTLACPFEKAPKDIKGIERNLIKEALKN